MHDRILKIIRHYNLSISEFSREIGLNSAATIQKIITYKRKASPKTTGKILNRFPEVEYDWLITGQGDMLKSNKETANAVNEDDLTVTSKQIINFIKSDVIDYVNKQIGINQVEFLNQIENVGEKIYQHMFKQAEYYLENKFGAIDKKINDIQNESLKSKNYYTDQHFANGEKIDNLANKLNDVIDNVEKLNVLIQQIETQDVINKDRIANFIEPKKKK